MINPFIDFNGNASEAIDFYEKVFKCNDKKVMRYCDAPKNPNFPIPQEMENYIMHAEMTICGTKVNISDTFGNEVTIGGNITLALNFETPEEVTQVFNELKEGGTVLMNCEPTFFSPMFGSVVDKFGTGWQIICRKDSE